MALSFAAPRYDDDVGICRPAQMQIIVGHGQAGIDDRLMRDLRLNEERLSGLFSCGFLKALFFRVATLVGHRTR
jgi:hypothetical protein